jgi:alkanesulfonate monooxygenase SsuD/methylene tetrahydromethanopterin reductase-like flavin-dependent oxidoreductase (luciferase family)
MEFVCNLMSADVHPGQWARAREAEGWDLIAVADHLIAADAGSPHVWATCGAIAAATTSIGLTTAFVNNLLRSPVEVAQAARSMQLISGNRFELGVGAGWRRAELENAGLCYPSPGERATRFAEAMQIIRQLLDHGSCIFHSQHYDVEIENVGPASVVAPKLIGAVGGPRTTAEVTPWCDAVEIKAASLATRSGTFDLAALATIESSTLTDLVARVRTVRPDIPIGMFVLCGTGAAAKRFGSQLPPSSLYSRFFGDPDDVAEAIVGLTAHRIGRAQISPLDSETFELLARVLPLAPREVDPEVP